MQISITEDEIKAIDFGLEQIREALEGSSSDDYKKCYIDFAYFSNRLYKINLFFCFIFFSLYGFLCL